MTPVGRFEIILPILTGRNLSLHLSAGKVCYLSALCRRAAGRRGAGEEMVRGKETRRQRDHKEKGKSKDRQTDRRLGGLGARPGGSMLIRVMTELTVYLIRVMEISHFLCTCLYRTLGTP